MRYFFITSGSLEKNASFIRLREFGRWLHAEGIEVHYAIDADAFNDTLPVQMPYGTFHRITGAGRLGRLLTRRHVIASIDPHVVHILNPQPSNSATIFGTRRFVVGDWDELLSVRSKSAAVNMLSRLCEMYGRRRADLTVVASRHMQRLFRDGYALDSVYLPYAAYLEHNDDGESPFDRPSVVYLGNLHHDSDFDILLETWGGPLAGPTAPPLHMIGGGTELDRVRQRVLAQGLENVHVHGFLSWPEAWRYLRHAAALVFPIRDNLANQMRCPAKTFAYMQAGRPIITNRVGEVAEILGDEGIYVEPTVQAFAQAVLETAVENRPDVSYSLHRHTWTSRTRTLLEEVRRCMRSGQ